ncbi:MAG: hypothetical protein RL068_528 [Actinomycetota bacterium]|jgi:hypothetical protein
MRRTFSFLLTFALLAGWAAPVSAVETDPNRELVWNLTQCKSKTELDCVESAAVWIKGKKIIGKQVSTIKTSGDNGNGTKITGAHGQWRFAGIPGTSELQARLESPKHVLWINEDGTKMRGSSLRVYFNGPVLQTAYKFEVKVRSSWIIPTDVQLHTDDGDWSRKLVKGGSIWTINGTPSKVYGYSDRNWQKKIDQGAKADWSDTRWGFLVHHAAPHGEGGYFDQACADVGFSVEGHNAPGAGKPFWDEQAETLFFNIQAATRDQRGNKVKGKFKLWMNTAYVQCMWPGSTLGMAKRLSVSVVSKDGKEQVVDSWSLVDTGMFKIEVNGFSYGDTTIRIKPLRITRICEGASGETQEVKGLDPQCPEGTTLVSG